MIPLILAMLLGSTIPRAQRVEVSTIPHLLVGSQGGGSDGPKILRYNLTSGVYDGLFADHGLSGLDPLGMTIGPDQNLYVVVGNGVSVNEVRRYNGATGASMGVFAKDGGMQGPSNVVFGPDGNLYVSSFNNGKVIRFHGKTGAYMGVFAHGGGLETPRGLAFGPDGNLYVVDYNRAAVVRYKGSNGAYIDTFVPKGSAGLGSPSDLKFGPDGNLYVTGGSVGGRIGVFRFDRHTGKFIDLFVSLPDTMAPIDLVFTPEGYLYITVQGEKGGVMVCNATTGKGLKRLVREGAGGGSGGLMNAFGLAYDPS